MRIAIVGDFIGRFHEKLRDELLGLELNKVVTLGNYGNVKTANQFAELSIELREEKVDTIAVLGPLDYALLFGPFNTIEQTKQRELLRENPLTEAHFIFYAMPREDDTRRSDALGPRRMLPSQVDNIFLKRFLLNPEVYGQCVHAGAVYGRVGLYHTALPVEPRSALVPVLGELDRQWNLQVMQSLGLRFLFCSHSRGPNVYSRNSHGNLLQDFRMRERGKTTLDPEDYHMINPGYEANGCFVILDAESDGQVKLESIVMTSR